MPLSFGKLQIQAPGDGTRAATITRTAQVQGSLVMTESTELRSRSDERPPTGPPPPSSAPQICLSSGFLIHSAHVAAALWTRKPRSHCRLLDAIPADMPSMFRAIVNIFCNAVSTKSTFEAHGCLQKRLFISSILCQLPNPKVHARSDSCRRCKHSPVASSDVISLYMKLPPNRIHLIRRPPNFCLLVQRNT